MRIFPEKARVKCARRIHNQVVVRIVLIEKAMSVLIALVVH